MALRVHPRVRREHPEVDPEDVEAAFGSTLRKVDRTDQTQCRPLASASAATDDCWSTSQSSSQTANS